MVSLKWCLQHKDGLRLIEPNKNMSDSYLGMAEDSILALSNVARSKIWTATMSYYIFYYSLYSLMLRIGVKCEIHSCSIAFMKHCLREFYSEGDVKMMEKAFSARNDLQYYADRPVEQKTIDEVKAYCKVFFIKTKDILASISENQIDKIRKELQKAQYTTDVVIGKGKMFGKAVFANRDFKRGEVVITYHLKPLTEEESQALSNREKNFTHKHWGKTYLYSEPERYVAHSQNPNTKQDLKAQCDIAVKDIKKGDEITTDATKDDV